MERQWKTRETERDSTNRGEKQKHKQRNNGWWKDNEGRERQREIVQIQERNKKTNREIMGDGKTMKDERERLRFLPKIKQCMWDIQRQHRDTAKQWERERREVIHVLTAFVK